MPHNTMIHLYGTHFYIVFHRNIFISATSDVRRPLLTTNIVPPLIYAILPKKNGNLLVNNIYTCYFPHNHTVTANR